LTLFSKRFCCARKYAFTACQAISSKHDRHCFPFGVIKVRQAFNHLAMRAFEQPLGDSFEYRIRNRFQISSNTSVPGIALTLPERKSARRRLATAPHFLFISESPITYPDAFAFFLDGLSAGC